MLCGQRRATTGRLLPAPAWHTHAHTLPCETQDRLPSALAPAQGSSPRASTGCTGCRARLHGVLAPARPHERAGQADAAALGLWPGPCGAPRQPPPHPAQDHSPNKRGGGESHLHPEPADPRRRRTHGGGGRGMAQGSWSSPRHPGTQSSPSRAPAQPRPPTLAPEFPVRKRRRPRRWPRSRQKPVLGCGAALCPPPCPPLPQGRALPCSDKAGGLSAACPRVPGSSTGQAQAAPGRAGLRRENRSSGVRASVSLTEAPVPGAG